MADNKNNLILTQEANTLLPLVKEFARLFPNNANEEEDTRLIMNFALALNGVKTKSGQPAVNVCSKESIYQCGLDILNKKLDLSKNQVYLIAYGDKLQLQDSYFGRVALVKRELGISIRGSIIHDGDKIDITVDETGLKHITQKTSWENINKNITGAYAIAYDKDGKVIESDIMTFQEIWTSWLQSQGGIKDTHKKFANEMARKTVEGRLAKHIYQKYSEEAIGFDYEDNDVSIPEEDENVIDLNQVNETPTVDANVSYEEINEVKSDPTPQENNYDYNDYVQTTQYTEPQPQPQPAPQYYNNQPQYQAPTQQYNNTTSQNNDDLIANAKQGDKIRLPYGKAKDLSTKTQNWKIVPNSYDASTRTALVERL